MKKIFVLLVLLVLGGAVAALAFTAEGCGAGTCADCHSLDAKEAGALLGDLVDKVAKVELAEIPGMWLVEVEKDSNRLPVYVDFSKQYVLSGSVIRLADRSDVSEQRYRSMNRVDVTRIPLGDALLLGKAEAKTRVFVFTDPQCPFCKKLHAELQEVVRRDPDIAFLIKLYPLKMHPEAYGIAKSIICARSLELLERSFAGQPVPPATCETQVVDQTMTLAASLGIQSTPTIVLPDGLVMPGYKRADDLLKLIRAQKVADR